MSTEIHVRSNARDVVEKRRTAWIEQLEGEVARMTELLKTCPGVRRVYLFGSLGRGEARWRSDIDLVVVQETHLRGPDRIEAILRLLRPRIQTDVLVVTPQELNEPAGERLKQHLARHGRLLYVAPQ